VDQAAAKVHRGRIDQRVAGTADDIAFGHVPAQSERCRLH
jgi:hypothetical protein